MNAILAINMFFRSMKHFEFIRFINMFRSNTHISKQILLRNIVRKKHNIVRQKILQNMKSSTKMNLAINNWTNSNNFAFMKIIDYFIDHEWRFRKILFTFKHFLNSHIEKSMSRKMMNILKNYKFERRLLNLTNDNALNNDKMRRFIRKILLKNDIEWNHEKNHVSYLTHVIQLTMNELFKSLKIFVINDIVNFVFKKAFVIHIANDLSLSTTLLKMCIFHRFFSQNKCLN
jgi:hypothetical protein